MIPPAKLFAAERGTIALARFDSIAEGTINSLRNHADFPNNPDALGTLTAFAAADNGLDNFGQRVHGLLHAPTTGEYTFYIASDNRAELWLSNTADAAQRIKVAEVTSAVGTQGFNTAAEQQSAPLLLVAGQTYFIEALHVDDTAADHLAVAWQPPTASTIDVIPGQHLSPVLPTVKAYAQQPVVSEGSATPARLIVVRTGGPLTEALTVQYDVSGTATNGTDYQNLPGTITIPAGQAISAPFAINAVDDGVPDAIQTVTLIASAAGFVDGTAKITVTDTLSHRMSNLTVHVHDQNGNPLPDATIDVSMTQHSFTFGTQVRHRLLGITRTEFDGLNDTQKQGLALCGQLVMDEVTSPVLQDS